MKKINEADTRGPYGGMAILPGESIILKLNRNYGSLPLSRTDGEPFTMGKASVREADDTNSDAQLDDQQEIEAVKNDFASKIKAIVAGAFKGKINGKLVGDDKLVPLVATMIKLEKSYLQNLMGGKAADEPLMVRTKAEIDKLAADLKRNSGLEWPFN
jgi:hypothetical protein